MSKCLIVLNSFCGHYELINQDLLKARFEKDYDTVDSFVISDDNQTWSAKGYNCVVICGGDGTFNKALNHTFDEGAQLIYYSFGTYNEASKTRAKGFKKHEFVTLEEYARANEKYFSYVFAAGSFTPLGYIVPPKKKKRLGILAYLAKVVSQYRVHNIKAKVTADGEVFDDTYTLIMFIDSMRCFGFNFNKLYSPSDGATHMLLIKSPGKDSCKNRMKIFGPLFKSFFIGFKKEMSNKKMVFKKVINATVSLQESVPFNIDGERLDLDSDVTVAVKKPTIKVLVGNPKPYTKKRK